MCHTLLSEIEKQNEDKTRYKRGKFCGLCDLFERDKDFQNIGICKEKNVTVWIKQECTIRR